MMQQVRRRGLLLRLYLLVSHLFPAIAGRVLRRRLARGKEHPTRWIEKQALGLASRPDGPLIWLHAVGLGEVLSLRGLIAAMARLRPEASFLVTSTTATSAEVFAKNQPPRSLHQFLPLDAPAYRIRFLDHFAPDLCVWAEQDLWPGFVDDLNRRHIPQAIVAARMNARSYRSHQKMGGLYRDLYSAMDMITAQDDVTAAHLQQLAADPAVTGSLKPAAPVLGHDPAMLKQLKERLKGRMIWTVAPSHAADESVALEAHAQLLKAEPTALLIIAPRFPERREEIAASFGADIPNLSRGQYPGPNDTSWLCDTFGEMGLVYRLAQAVLIGGTFDATEGHNPWEAAALDTAILHGPRTANFAPDFAELDATGGALQVRNASQLAEALTQADRSHMIQNARTCIETASARTDQLARDLIALLDAA